MEKLRVLDRKILRTSCWLKGPKCKSDESRGPDVSVLAELFSKAEWGKKELQTGYSPKMAEILFLCVLESCCSESKLRHPKNHPSCNFVIWIRFSVGSFCPHYFTSGCLWVFPLLFRNDFGEILRQQ